MNNSEYFRSKLTTLKAQLCDRISSINQDVRQKVAADWQEQATERENDEVLDSLSRSSVNKLLLINIALQRIDVDEYFSCSICGNEIPTKRLELLPFTTHCVSCAEKSQH